MTDADRFGRHAIELLIDYFQCVAKINLSIENSGLRSPHLDDTQ